MKLRVKSKQVFAVAGFAFMAISGGNFLYAATTSVETYDLAKPYTVSGTRVAYYERRADGTHQVGVFQNGWYLGAGVTPNFVPNGNGWAQVGDSVIVATLDDENGTTNPTPAWSEVAAYGSGALVSSSSVCYKAKWWTTDKPPSNSWDGVSCPPGKVVANPLKNTTSTSAGESSDTTPVVEETSTSAGESSDTTPVVEETSTSAGESSDTTPVVEETNTVIVQSDSSNNTVTVETKPVAPVEVAPPSAANPFWTAAAVYHAGGVVQHSSVCYKAKWWTSGNTPIPSQDLKNQWDSPWAQLSGCPVGGSGAALPANSTVGQTASSAASDPAQVAAAQPTSPKINTISDTATAAEVTAAAAAATKAAADATSVTVTAAIPPMVPKESVNTSTPVSVVAPTQLPDEGYAFLRLMTVIDWDWLFPLRSGRYHDTGGTRNSPPFALVDGSTDTFSLDAFKRAVLQYNTWAKQNNYKQFLNEGTIKQQAQEFLVFWAKSSRETSGSWSNAPAPWITKETFKDEIMDVWRGGMYWVEEVGYTTNSATGLSPAINYVDGGSTDFPPSPGRSYYGRGPIQLSWNYNYGAFSYWMYDNGLFKNAADAAGRCKIDTRNKLLEFPNLVADCGDISTMSAIWFWQTPQGAKPSSHDVIYGEAINISKSGQDRGLPQTNSGYVPKVASGDTSDPEVFAFRLGTVINIVNGGLECNKAAQWHNGPLQRVSYYNAYAAHFNEKYNLDVPRVKEATNVWTKKVSATSPLNLQSATCYNQKSYYGW